MTADGLDRQLLLEADPWKRLRFHRQELEQLVLNWPSHRDPLGPQRRYHWSALRTLLVELDNAAEKEREQRRHELVYGNVAEVRCEQLAAEVERLKTELARPWYRRLYRRLRGWLSFKVIVFAPVERG